MGWRKINLHHNCSDENTVSLGWQDVFFFRVSKIWKSQNTRLSIHFSVLVRARHSSTIHASNITQIQAHMHSYHTNIRPTHKLTQMHNQLYRFSVPMIIDWCKIQQHKSTNQNITINTNNLLQMSISYWQASTNRTSLTGQSCTNKWR